MRAPLSVRNRRATLLATCGLLCLGPGACDRDRNREKDTASAPFPASRSVERTSYEAVTSRLDRGGRVFAYWSTESWLEDLSDGVEEWKEAVLEWRALPSPQRVRIERMFNVAGRLIRNSGLEQISGVGLSTISLEPDLYHTRTMLHHHSGNDRGYLWSLFGKSAHPLQALDLLPADTALAVVTDLNLPLLWAAVEQELTQIDLPETREWVRRFPARFEERTGLKFYRMLASLDGECGFILTLDSERTFTMPLPSGEEVALPEPGLVLVVRVKDDTLFNRVSDWLASGEHARGSETNPIRRLSLPAPDSLPLPLAPALVRSGNYLLLASTGRLMDEVLAVQGGARPGLKHSEEFQRLSLRVPTEGNRFTFVSRRLGDSLGTLGDRMMTGPNTRAAERRLLRGFLNPDQFSGSWSVWSRVEQGWFRVGNSNRAIT
ncbi:MAG TPA: hypothetical protein VMS21_13565, partial [Methylomirabilota bacterium]|nr:hypothetical protein [Methylomirabilota bacterium]